MQDESPRTCQHCGGLGAKDFGLYDGHEDIPIECLESLRDQIRTLTARVAELEQSRLDATTVTSVTNAFVLAQPHLARVRELLRGKELYRTHDIIAACSDVEREAGRVYAPDMTTIEAICTARQFSACQTTRVRELLSGTSHWRDDYRTVDILDACREVEREENGDELITAPPPALPPSAPGREAVTPVSRSASD